MKKTNLRINNCFIFFEKNKYFLTDIDILDDWLKTENKDLNDFVKKYNDISTELNTFMNKFNIKSNVNFIIEDFENLKKSKEILTDKKITIKKGGLQRSL
jgi:archaellum component FlaC